MTFSYSGDPSASDRDALRFLLQDTISPGDMSDEELDYLLAQYTTVLQAALAAARTLFARFSRQVSKAVGDLRIDLSDRAANWARMIDTLQDTIAVQEPGGVYAGGQSLAEQDADDVETDLTKGRFRLGMHAYPESSSDDVFVDFPELS